MADLGMSPPRKGVEIPTWDVIFQTSAINDGVSEFSYHTDKWILTPSFRSGVNILKDRGFPPAPIEIYKRGRACIPNLPIIQPPNQFLEYYYENRKSY